MSHNFCLSNHNLVPANYNKSSDSNSVVTRDTNSVMTRTPSPTGDFADIVTDQKVQVIMDSLTNSVMTSSDSPSLSDNMNPSECSLEYVKEDGDVDDDEEEEEHTNDNMGSTASTRRPSNLSQSLPANSNNGVGGGGGSSATTELPKRWKPKGRSSKKSSTGLFASFSKKKNQIKNFSNHSSHPSSLTFLEEEEDGDTIRRNSDHSTSLTDVLKDQGCKTASDVSRLINNGRGRVDSNDFSPHPSFTSTYSRGTTGDMESLKGSFVSQRSSSELINNEFLDIAELANSLFLCLFLNESQ